MNDDDGLWGFVNIGPPVEHLRYMNSHHRRTERMFFWAIVSALIESEPGDEDALPRWMTEDAAYDLVSNAQPMES